MDQFVKQEKVVDAFMSAIRATKERLDVLNAYIDDHVDEAVLASIAYCATQWPLLRP